MNIADQSFLYSKINLSIREEILSKALYSADCKETIKRPSGNPADGRLPVLGRFKKQMISQGTKVLPDSLPEQHDVRDYSEIGAKLKEKTSRFREPLSTIKEKERYLA